MSILEIPNQQVSVGQLPNGQQVTIPASVLRKQQEHIKEAKRLKSSIVDMLTDDVDLTPTETITLEVLYFLVDERIPPNE